MVAETLPMVCDVPGVSPSAPLQSSFMFLELAKLIQREPFRGLTLRAYETQRTFYFERIEPRTETIRAFLLANAGLANDGAEVSVNNGAPTVSFVQPKPAPGLRALRELMARGLAAAYVLDYWGGRMVVFAPSLTSDARSELTGLFGRLPNAVFDRPMPFCTRAPGPPVSSLDIDDWYIAPKPRNGRFVEPVRVTEVGADVDREHETPQQMFDREAREGAEGLEQLRQAYLANPPREPDPPKCYGDARFLAWQERMNGLLDAAGKEAFANGACSLFDTVASMKPPGADLNLQQYDVFYLPDPPESPEE